MVSLFPNPGPKAILYQGIDEDVENILSGRHDYDELQLYPGMESEVGFIRDHLEFGMSARREKKYLLAGPCTTTAISDAPG